ncbi:MAG: RnfABCDGE type electron transport complex subunit B [Neisseria sp.]|nr:RnfABCDGE type electron transport complex subunit B [Neisseria sp.]
MSVSADSVNRLLPQTQCRECGFEGCLPYAEAMVRGESGINLCAPGGEAVMLDLAALLQREPLAPAKIQPKTLAWIDEAVCIGCTACIRACPTDAIMGASKLMHTVIADECTGCGLCVTPCPVDCIYLRPVEADFLPLARSLGTDENEARFAASAHALTRYRRREARRARDAAERKAHIAAREAAARAAAQAVATAAEKNETANKAAFNPAALIAQAMARASAQQEQRTVPANRESFKEQQIREAQEKATFRRYQRDAQYGSEAEKAAAIEWLRRYKAEQEAKSAAKS